MPFSSPAVYQPLSLIFKSEKKRDCCKKVKREKQNIFFVQQGFLEPKYRLDCFSSAALFYLFLVSHFVRLSFPKGEGTKTEMAKTRERERKKGMKPVD